jgi:hypothetical protein
MLRRFVAASAIACIGIACAAFIVSLIPGLPWQRAYPLAVLWCFAPLVWGIWAMLAPSSGFPERLPVWGALLGLLAGQGAALLNMPSRVLGVTLSPTLRGIWVIVMVVVYYFLWMLVRAVYRALAPAEPAAPKSSKAAA